MSTTDPQSPDYITPYNRMNIIIDEVGEYMTRDGRKIIIDKIIDHSDNLSVTRFNCKGHLVVKKGNKTTYVYDIWHESGKYTGVVGHKLDIIMKAY